MRLNQFLAACGACSRRGAEKLILAGRIRVNGRTCRELATRVEPGSDRVLLDGVQCSLPAEHVYILLNKPRGVLTTLEDPRGRPTVRQLVDLPRRLFPVGRLDRDSAGALLMTDDGELARDLLHPSRHVPKEYIVLADRDLTPEELRRVAEGIRIDGRRTLPCLIERIGRPGSRPRYRIVLREGRNRQVRRMLATLGIKVLRLTRRSFGGLSLGRLEPGCWRFLGRREVQLLRRRIRRDEKQSPKAASARDE